MSTFGYYPGQIDYWLFLTDWRNGSVAILLALVVGALAFIFTSSRQAGRMQPDNPLPIHASPAISESAGDEASSALSSTSRNGKLKAEDPSPATANHATGA